MGKQRKGLGIGPAVYRWEAPDGSPWDVEMHWAVIDGRAECVGMMLRSYRTLVDPDDPDPEKRPISPSEGLRPISSGPWRAVPMSLIDQARADWADTLTSSWSGKPDERREPFTKEAGRGRKLTGADGRELPVDEALAQVADIYRKAWRSGAKPTKAVAEAMQITTSAAAKRVRRARDAGLLPETSQGRPTAADDETKGS